MLRVLYLGWMSYCEYSLWYEGQVSDDLEVLCLPSGGCPGLPEAVSDYRVKSLDDVNAIRKSFNPDIVLVRTWSGIDSFIRPGDVTWSLEINPTLEDGSSAPNPKPSKSNRVAYGNKLTAEKDGQYWLPYCVGSYESRSNIKDIPIMLATNLPSSDYGGRGLKTKSLEILARPIVEWNSDMLYTYVGWCQDIKSLSYLTPTFKEGFSAIESCGYASRAKIYLSPTSIWYDAGAISHKTIQAMACGTLVVTNNYPGIEAIIGCDGDTVVYANTPEETLEKVRYYLANDRVRKDVEDRAYDFIHSAYGWKYHLERLYGELSCK